MAIGALIGALYLSGPMAAVVYYGVAIVSPKFYYVTVFIIASLVAMMIGSTSTVAGMIGMAFIGLASAVGVSTAITLGAAISGAVVGFAASRILPVASLTVTAVGVNMDEHARSSLR